MMFALMTAILAAITPLTDDQRTAIDTAVDDRDHRDSAFVSLLETAHTWTPGPGSAAVRLDVDVTALLADPDAHRGVVHRIEGVLQDSELLPEPYANVAVWYLRLDSGEPVAVYVTDRVALPDDGERVEVFARFYKRLGGTDRRGQSSSWAAFIGNHPVMLPGPTGTTIRTPVIVTGAVAVMFVVFGALLVLARRSHAAQAGSRPGGGTTDRDWDGDDPSLPDDPAEALAVLRARAKEDGHDAGH
ncbi:MAG: hypothetical protein AAF432_05765 [Planctomycetota bacterium]